MKFSDEMINAYADGELQSSEKAEFELAMQSDPELQKKLEELLALKSQLKLAYADVELPSQVPVRKANYRAAGYAALLALAFSSGWLGSEVFESRSYEASVERTLAGGISAPVEQAPGKYILHVGRHDEASFKDMLDKAEYLASRYQNDMKLIELEIIANAEGLDFLRKDVSPYAQRVKELSARYPNIRFIACSNAIERLREKGIEPELISAVHKGPTALDQVVRRMNEGWTYIKI